MKNEIIITHVHLETPIVISENFVQLLILENPNEFYRMVMDLDSQFDGGDGLFVFSSNGQVVQAQKSGAMVSDLFHFDLNDKKIVNLLYKKLETVAFGDKVKNFNELTSKTTAFIEDLAYTVPFSVDYNELQPVDFLKLAGVKFAKAYDSLEEKLVCYINALIELKNCDFFVFVNLKSVLSDEKLIKIYEHCRLEQVGLFLIESGKRDKVLLDCEKAIIITEDLCEILENY
ncbi:MAG: type II-A CRISPR-associated protein Csn2 [Clostridia bacterium]|nr:type II-A CRISPR-associated protein Csn2 [Clostridia bacterium]